MIDNDPSNGWFSRNWKIATSHRCFRVSASLTSPSTRVHDAGSDFGDHVGVVAGGVRQYPADPVAAGPAVHRFPSEFSNTVVQKDVLHSDRVHITPLSRRHTL